MGYASWTPNPRARVRLSPALPCGVGGVIGNTLVCGTRVEGSNPPFTPILI